MKPSFLSQVGIILASIVLFTSLSAAETPDKKVAELKERFQKGLELLSQRKYKEARDVFDKNIAEDPKSLGSLLFAGIASNELFEHQKALEYFDKYQTFDSSDERLMLGMLRAYQALGNSKEAEEIVVKVRAMKASGIGKYLPMMTDFERERIRQADGRIVSVLEVFERKPRRAAWKYLMLDANLKPLQLLELVEATEQATAKARAADPKIGSAAVYLMQESSLSAENPMAYKIFKTLIGLPKYEDARALALEVFSGKIKPIAESK